MESLSGSVERITYYNAENGYCVFRLKAERIPERGATRDGLVTVTGHLPELSPGEHLRLTGRWVNHPKHGLQFQCETCEQTLPATIAGIRRYLGSGLIKGIGPKLAERIVAQFGSTTLEVIEHHPERLTEVPDIGPKRSALISRAWEEQKQVKEIMLFLHSYGVSTNLAVKIYKQYGDQALAVVQSDPYRLARDIFGVGFKTADRIAQALGLPEDHPSRIEAALVYLLNTMSDDGHVFVPRNVLVEQTMELLGDIPAELIQEALDRLSKDERIRSDLLPMIENGVQPLDNLDSSAQGIKETRGEYRMPAIYLNAFYHSETNTAALLRKLADALPSRLSDLPPAFISLDPHLTEEQKSALRTALSHPVSILTGGPGTGKTTALKALIAVLEQGRKSYALASPTGRAAKRLAEATGRPASTLHRLLGYTPGEGFKHNARNPLSLDMLVVDEASMIDLMLAYHVLQALPHGCHLLLVGDVDQLPSVGAGDVLRDVIASGIAPVTRLSHIFRQAAHSQIVVNAHRVNQGLMPIFSPRPDSAEIEATNDFFLFPAETAEEAANWVEEVVCRRIPEKFGLDPLSQIQVLAPMYRGPAGVTALNERLQARLNPPSLKKAERSLFGQIFRLRDRVMQTQNDYDKDVFNGDIGLVVGIDPIEHTLTVDFEGRRVEYDWSEADRLVLAYAISVHKAQGSEFPAVVMPIITSHYIMLQRNLLYTAITRAKELCVLVGSRKAIGIAVRNNKVARRYTALDWRLTREG